jgi:phospholipid/cholesterol/gamma-HCH transport system ATP-binding protein
LDEVGLLHTKDQMPSELSGGMKKRIGIARTLILNPKIMLYDEPTAGLDPQTAADINDLILQVQQTHHTSSIIITHDLSCAHATGDRIIGLFDGYNKIEGTYQSLKENPPKELVSFFNYMEI